MANFDCVDSPWIMFWVTLDFCIAFGHNEIIYVHFYRHTYKMIETWSYDMWIASLVLAHSISCMHMVLDMQRDFLEALLLKDCK